MPLDDHQASRALQSSALTGVCISAPRHAPVARRGEAWHACEGSGRPEKILARLEREGAGPRKNPMLLQGGADVLGAERVVVRHPQLLARILRPEALVDPAVEVRAQDAPVPDPGDDHRLDGPAVLAGHLHVEDAPRVRLAVPVVDPAPVLGQGAGDLLPVDGRPEHVPVEEQRPPREALGRLPQPPGSDDLLRELEQNGGARLRRHCPRAHPIEAAIKLKTDQRIM
eukprot:XP_001709460.1 Hypothetical protein GL50803_113865 [Giardia lamblia ATCC 50803]